LSEIPHSDAVQNITTMHAQAIVPCGHWRMLFPESPNAAQQTM